MVEYHPISAKDQTRLHQFGKTVLPGIFFGYALVAGGIWKRFILVADIEEVENLDASEIHALRLNGVLMPKNGQTFTFPEIRFSEDPPYSRNTVHEAKNLQRICITTYTTTTKEEGRRGRGGVVLGG